MSIGGVWALSYPRQTRRNLSWFWYNGFFASASDNIVITYLTLYALALGASQTQIGLLSSLSSLSGALLLLPGAALVERLGNRKGLSQAASSSARLLIGLLAIVPFLFQGQVMIATVIALAVARDALNNLAYPAWIALTADIVPLEGRGRYFASRNFAMGVAGMFVTLMAGLIITRSGVPGGYQLALLAAFLFGVGSVACYARLQDPGSGEPAGKSQSLKLTALLGDLRSQPGFTSFLVASALWNFSLNVAGPFFTVYHVEVLKASPTLVGLSAIASSLAPLVLQRKLGELADRWGARRLQLVSSLIIPILPILWALISYAWLVIPINLLSGILWAGYNLASFTFLLAIVPQTALARYSALYQLIVLLSLAAGAAVGGILVTTWGFAIIFWASGIGRLLAALLFARYVQPSTPVSGLNPGKVSE